MAISFEPVMKGSPAGSSEPPISFPRRVRTFVVFLLLLAPSLVYCWRYRDMPEFGRYHDDGLLFVSAKGLAEGQGFRIVSLPEQPAQTKYPILYSLYLTLVWKLNPHFPENLTLARFASWILLAISLALAWVFFRKEGFAEGKTILLTALLAANPYMIFFGANTFSEIFFLCLLLLVFLAARGGDRGALVAGIAAGCAYLSRTAGVAFLISVPAWYLWRRERKRAFWFLAAMLPFVVGWTIWSRTHLLHTTDETLIYYTDYSKMEFLTVGLDNFYVILWKNFDSVLYAIGGLAIPQILSSLPAKILTQVVGVAAIAGTVRLFRRGIAAPYALFAAVSTLMLLVWHFPSNPRFVLPLFPLVLAGLVTEIEHVGQMLRTAFRHKDRAQRVVAGAMTACLVAILGGALFLQGLVSFYEMYRWADEYRQKLAGMREAYRWIAENVPDTLLVLSNDDPLLYLYSGRRGHVVPLVPRSWYADDHQSTIAAYRGIANYCRSHGFSYFYSTPDETSRWFDDPNDVGAVQQAIRENPQLIPVFVSHFGTVYRVR